MWMRTVALRLSPPDSSSCFFERTTRAVLPIVKRLRFFLLGNKKSATTVYQSEEEVMKTTKTFITLGLALVSVIMLPAARADEYDQATELTFNQSVQIPGRVLPAGTYWFELAKVNSRNVVQVFNSDRSTLYATILTVDAARPKPTDSTAITFAERGAMQPETMVLWFYPGRSSGHQFVYANPERQELAQVKQHTVMATTRDRSQAVVVGD
jgi:hypothetical protein